MDGQDASDVSSLSDVDGYIVLFQSYFYHLKSNAAFFIILISLFFLLSEVKCWHRVHLRSRFQNVMITGSNYCLAECTLCRNTGAL